MIFPMGPLLLSSVKTLFLEVARFLHPNYRKLDSVEEWDTWRREKANHIQCHSTAEYGFVPPKFRWWHFESLEQFPEEVLPKPPMQYMGLWLQGSFGGDLDISAFGWKTWIIPKGMLDALHPYLSPNLREDQHHIAHIPRIVVDNQVL
ncbi:hypothetical protein AAG906_015463 [Vitis piasezkii]